MALYAFDGTWNSDHDAGEYGQDTNVVKFARVYDDQKVMLGKDGEAESVKNLPAGAKGDDVFFEPGVGTRLGRVGRVFGGAFGAGGRVRISEAKAAAKKRYAAGDPDVDIVGFSRGAALALHFANVLHGEKIPVRFLGVWDIVAAFGVPVSLGPIPFQRINLGYKLTLPDNVKYCFHAMAMDERRPAFIVTRVDNGYQVWFRGVHSDIGGGNDNEKLSNIALRWMLRKAAKAGLPVDANAAGGVGADAHVKVAGKIQKDFRELKKNDRVHYAVDVRKPPQCQNRPEGCPVESEQDESNRILTTEELKKQV